MSVEADIRYMMAEWGYSYGRAKQALEDGEQADVAIERMESRLDSMLIPEE